MTAAASGATVLVVGKGAIGTALAAYATQIGLTAGVLGRQGPIAHQALFASAPDAPPLALALPVVQPAQADLVLVAVKAFDLGPALLGLVPALKPQTPVLVFANGAVDGMVREAATRFPALAFRLGLVTFGVSEIEGGFAVRSVGGEASFGPLAAMYDAPVKPIERSLAAPTGVFRWRGDVLMQHRRKWVFNTVINTMCAAGRLPCNGDLIAHEADVRAVFAEAFALAVRLWGPWPATPESLWTAMVELIRATAGNENSMARDVRLGRRTESAYLAGLAPKDGSFPRLNALHAQLAS